MSWPTTRWALMANSVSATRSPTDCEYSPLLFYSIYTSKQEIHNLSTIQHGDQEGVGGRDKESCLESGGGKVDREIHDTVDTRDQILGSRDRLRFVRCSVELLGHRPVPHAERMGHDQGEAGTWHGTAKGKTVPSFFPLLYTIKNSYRIYIYVYIHRPMLFWISTRSRKRSS